MTDLCYFTVYVGKIYKHMFKTIVPFCYCEKKQVNYWLREMIVNKIEKNITTVYFK